MTATAPPTKLTDKQRRFCEEYLVDFNATAAYGRAGYSGSVQAMAVSAHQLLRNPKIQAYLAEVRRVTSEAAKVTLERTIEEIAAVAFANITQVLSFTDGGVTLNDSTTLPLEVTAAIESITVNESITEGGRTVRKQVKLHNKMTALGFLANYFGINDDFNTARATLKRYGLALIEDPENPTGWSVRPYES
ncbi:terminase small subunit [Nodosilinea sp. FACHB-13]|uniref:terminase small subunit n=1 Tax=Cyanophyceae TaxID=3028117 RepID=UPI001682BB03|nr:terminase small subunit [Nodosilinea sp. FACHB-13]MBD2106717.1 terminase small subunit [Nodosilinea sp. FACHB-13]